MDSRQPEVVFLKDYRSSDYQVVSFDLCFNLQEMKTRVTSHMKIVRAVHAAPQVPLCLSGEKLKLVSIAIDDAPLLPEHYELGEAEMKILVVPDKAVFTLCIENEIDPAENKALLGLYMSNDFFVTQCEPEGFRRITWSLDRPDVMATFRTRIEADKDKYPVLLSNGNCIGSGDIGAHRHFAQWEDPHPKPTYLFALVAGDLGVYEDEFRTTSGRDVALKVFVEQGKQDRCAWAMESLKRSMKWDEDTFGFEYDLDTFMIVAISAFNGGAMENKGLNIFSDKYILADPQTATDLDYENIEGVVAHEYFHNWTGNRITCRDWFQLCLKEGLTVFRDQMFSSDMRSEAVKRIKDVQTLRRAQFPEDAGPLAHPARPASFIEIDNFFTPTVYEKGAEICRMIDTTLGREGFVKGMSLYQERHDGEAATVEQFVSAMSDATGKDLSGLLAWYSQSGTPQITSRATYDASNNVLDLTIWQITHPTPDQKDKAPLSMPLRMGLIGKSGQDIALRLEGEAQAGSSTRVFTLDQAETHFRFVDIDEEAVPSLFRGFSAPIRIMDEEPEALGLHRMRSDSDPFNRWEAGRRYTMKVVCAMAQAIAAGKPPQVPNSLIEITGEILGDETLDPAFRALVLALPTEREIALEMDVVRAEPIHKARKLLQKAIGSSHAGALEGIYSALKTNEPYTPDAASVGKRALRNYALSMLSASGLEAYDALAVTQFQLSDNMTDTMAALQVVTHSEAQDRETCLSAFFEKWSGESTIVDKWLALQAVSTAPGTLERVMALMEHEAFSLDIPNRVNSLLSMFAYNNPRHFHDESGKAYNFLTDQILKLEKINPATAASLCEAFASWKKFEPEQSALMKAQLERIVATDNLSPNLFEIASKLLA